MVMSLSGSLFAKGKTTKIVVTRPDLVQPLTLTAADVLVANV
jgi:hypothetical protein